MSINLRHDRLCGTVHVTTFGEVPVEADLRALAAAMAARMESFIEAAVPRSSS